MLLNTSFATTTLVLFEEINKELVSKCRHNATSTGKEVNICTVSISNFKCSQIIMVSPTTGMVIIGRSKGALETPKLAKIIGRCPHLWGWRTSSGKSWIRHWLERALSVTTMSMKNPLGWSYKCLHSKMSYHQHRLIALHNRIGWNGNPLTPPLDNSMLRAENKDLRPVVKLDDLTKISLARIIF